jgi:short-subunit dehydrogenase
MSPLVFITGASSGIGQALAARYAAAGWRLALVARRDHELRAWAAAAHGLSPGRWQAYHADVSVTDSIVAAANACMESQGVPDVVVASAGISVGIDTAQRADLDVMARTFATNNTGLAATFHPFVNPMKARGNGTLVGIASVAAIRGLPGQGAYCASKAGVVNYCESLRAELRPSGIRVVTLLPGFVDTPMTRGNPYPMPFLISAEDFAERALRAIELRKSYCVIPWQMAITAKLLRIVPDALFDRVLLRLARKPRQPGA